MLDPKLRDEAPEITNRTLRQFAALSLVVFGALGIWQAVAKSHVTAGIVLGAAAVLVGTVGLAAPQRIRPLFMVLMAIAGPIGLVVSRLLLAVLFYSVFTPLGILFRLFGRDALQLRSSARPSDWVAKAPVTDLRSYTRQA